MANELAIFNMITLITNYPGLYTSKELEEIKYAIKKHTLLNAKMILSKTESDVKDKNCKNLLLNNKKFKNYVKHC